MLHAIQLALRGAGTTSPNPLVGAVLVKNGRIIGEGYHETFGELHAERLALFNCLSRGENPAGADLYVTLEPCCHHGKQPPCTEALISAGIRRVFIGSRDPNPLVSGLGAKSLRENGIKVTEDVLREKCDAINFIFFHYIRTGLPFVLLKYAMSLDGKTAYAGGCAGYITGCEARKHVHETRKRYASILVGINTVLTDDPMLNCRIPDGKNPVRVICDSKIRIPLRSRIVKSASEIRTVIACAEENRTKECALQKAGCEIWHCGNGTNRVDLKTLLRRLGEDKIDSVLLEGGQTLSWSFLEQGLINRIHAYISPKMIGGAFSPTPVAGSGATNPSDAFHLCHLNTQFFGEDLLIEADVETATTCDG